MRKAASESTSFCNLPREYFLAADSTVVASMRRTEALASVKFYQILSIFIFFIRLIILEDFIRLISYNGPCVRLGCSFFLATALDRGDVYIIKGHKNWIAFISLLLIQKQCIQKIIFLKKVCLGVGFPSQVSSSRGSGKCECQVTHQ